VSKRQCRIWLILASIVYGALGCVTAFAWMFLVVFFDSGVNARAAIAVVVVGSFPILALVALVGGWRRFRTGAYASAIRFLLLPLPSCAIMLAPGSPFGL